MKKAIFESLGLLALCLIVQVFSYFLAASLFELSIGDLLAWTTFLTAALMTGLLLVIAKVHERLDVYFGRFALGKPKDWLLGFGCLVAFWAISEILAQWLNKTPMEFMDEISAGTDTGIGLWLIFVVVFIAPVYEELLFRGAIFGRLYGAVGVSKPIQDSKFWLAGALSGLLFAVLHMQYDWFGLAMIFALAYILSWARVATGGLILPIVLHLVNNAIAMTVYLLEL